MSGGHNTEDSVGDNKNFAVAKKSDVTVIFNSSANTSANDTATTKYTTNKLAAKKWNLRSDQTVRVVSMNNITLTDPIDIIINKGHTERYDSPLVFTMVIRTTVANTNIKLRLT